VTLATRLPSGSAQHEFGQLLPDPAAPACLCSSDFTVETPPPRGDDDVKPVVVSCTPARLLLPMERTSASERHRLYGHVARAALCCSCDIVTLQLNASRLLLIPKRASRHAQCRAQAQATCVLAQGWQTAAADLRFCLQ